MTKKKYLFIFVITGEYKNFHRKSFIENFSKFIDNDKVIVINRAKDLFFATIFNRDRLKEPFRIYKNNIDIIRPQMIIHDQISYFLPKIIKFFNYISFKIKFIKYLLEYTDRKKIIIVMHPNLMDYIDIINPDITIYDMYDEFLYPNYSKNKEKKEKKLINKSDLICTVSKYLKEKKESLYNIKNIFELNNAIDSDLFSKIEENKIKYNYNKVVGFVGNIKNYIDFDLIIYLAKKRKDVQFVIIGFNPNEEIKNKTKELNNIIFEGNKKYEELPKYIKSFDIGIIPYKVDDTHIKSISPMKLYEYLACNIFVLSSPIPDVVNFKINSNMGTYVEIANNYNEFLEKLDSLIVRDKFQLTEEEIYTISWEKRFSDLFEELNKLGIIEYNKKS